MTTEQIIQGLEAARAKLLTGWKRGECAGTALPYGGPTQAFQDRIGLPHDDLSVNIYLWYDAIVRDHGGDNVAVAVSRAFMQDAIDSLRARA